MFKDMKKEMIESLDTHGFRSSNFRSVAADIMHGVMKDFTDLNGRPCDPMNVLRPSFCKMIGCYTFILVTDLVTNKVRRSVIQ
jgi:hypothetical protein